MTVGPGSRSISNFKLELGQLGQLAMDDFLDDAQLWDAIESAAASSRLRKALPPPPPPPRSPSYQFAYRNPCRPRPRPNPNPYPYPEAGEVLQPEKRPRLLQESMDRRMVVVPRQPDSGPAASALLSPVNPLTEASPVVQSPSPSASPSPVVGSRHSLLSGDFPSVATFKQFQAMALAVISVTSISTFPFLA